MLSARNRTIFGKTSSTIESRFIREIDENVITKENTLDKTNTTQKRVGNMYNETSEDIKSGDKVNHTAFGDGVVISVSGGLATIAFKFGVGIKTIAINHKYLTSDSISTGQVLIINP